MWMVGCSNGSEVNTSDSSLLNGRKLKPLIPRPTACASSRNAAMSFAIATHHHPYIPNCTIHATSDELLALNHRLAERYKKDFEEQQQLLASATSRWNPTPEQLQALEDIYRRGTRTPSSEQIQQIAAQLRRFGKIEGKNVFYWFQNHKARERQKRRRISEPASKEQQGHVGNLETPESGLRRTSCEVGQTKNWRHPSNCSTISEEPVSIHSAAVIAESRPADGWIQFEEERESLQRRNTVEKHDTCQMMELSCSPTTQYFINNTTTTTTEALTRTIEKKLPTNREKISSNYHEDHENIGDQSQTLELFPLRSDDCKGDNYVREDHNINNFNTPIQFFEFLPLKN